MEKQIIIIKPKSLSSRDKTKLTKAGNIVIEHKKANEINYRSNADTVEYDHQLCITCGERIYMTKEKISILRMYKRKYYCSNGHNQQFR